MSHCIEAGFDQVPQIIRDGRQPRGAVRRRFVQERQQIPAQFGGAQAQFALVRVERLVFAHLGENAFADFRRAIGQEIFPLGGRHRQQFAE